MEEPVENNDEKGDLRKHLKTNRREKPNKCNQCDYASSRADSLRRRLKMHSGEKSNCESNISIFCERQFFKGKF